VTLHSPGTAASSGNNSAGSGKIIDLPRGGLNKIGAQPNSKLGGETARLDDRSAKSFQPIHVNQQPGGLSRSNIATPPKFRQELGLTHGASDLRMASTQFHGAAVQPQAGSGGKFGRW